jgi:aspartate aminotransferase
MVKEGFLKHGISVQEPEGSFFSFIEHPRNVTSETMVELALRNGVAVRPGAEFGPSGEGFVRLAFSTGGEELRTGVDRLAAAFVHAQKSA